jgi:hypothetical protein
MSSNDSQQIDIIFTIEEIELIKNITLEYQQVMKSAFMVQKAIEDAEKDLVIVTEAAEQIKLVETNLFEEMAVKYDLDPITLQNIAANKILSGEI